MAINIYEKMLQIAELATFLASRKSVAALEELLYRTQWATYSLEIPKIAEEVKKHVKDCRNSARTGDKEASGDEMGLSGAENRPEEEQPKRVSAQPVHRRPGSGRVSKRKKSEADAS